jgi:hypothetical protein
MPIGDPLYQLNDLVSRVKVLENAARAAVPGNRPSHGPDHPLLPVTSQGQAVPGADSDLLSRLTTAVQASLSGVESLYDVLTAEEVTNFGGGATQVIHRTNYIRPDPIVGDVFRIFAAGDIQNGTGGAISVDYFFDISGGGGVTLATFVVGAFSEVRMFQLHILFTVTVAGSAGVAFVITRATDTVAATLGIPTSINVDVLNEVHPSFNLVAPVPRLFCTSSVVDASIVIRLRSYTLERLGPAPFNKA